jgi:hypothetical protein
MRVRRRKLTACAVRPRKRKAIERHFLLARLKPCLTDIKGSREIRRG